MNHVEFRAIAEHNRFTALFKHRVDHVSTHHIPSGKSGFSLPAVNANKGLAEVDLLNKLAG